MCGPGREGWPVWFTTTLALADRGASTHCCTAVAHAGPLPLWLQCHTFLGTVTYMSPERINGQPYSFPADIWALVGAPLGGLGSTWDVLAKAAPVGGQH